MADEIENALRLVVLLSGLLSGTVVRATPKVREMRPVVCIVKVITCSRMRGKESIVKQMRWFFYTSLINNKNVICSYVGHNHVDVNMAPILSVVTSPHQ